MHIFHVFNDFKYLKKVIYVVYGSLLTCTFQFSNFLNVRCTRNAQKRLAMFVKSFRK